MNNLLGSQAEGQWMTGVQSVGEEEPRIVVLSGPSGTGKTTVVRRLLSTAPVPVIKAITATTRPPRPAEVHGRDYHFLTFSDFMQRREEEYFLETAEVFGTGTWYGTPRSEVDRAQLQKAWSLLEIDVRGALEIKKQFPHAVMIFLRTASAEDYETRLRQRGTESDEAIQCRLERMKQELPFAQYYDFQVINDDVDRAVAEIGGILQRREAERNA